LLPSDWMTATVNAAFDAVLLAHVIDGGEGGGGLGGGGEGGGEGGGLGGGGGGDGGGGDGGGDGPAHPTCGQKS